MKKLSLLALIVTMVIAFTQCRSARSKATSRPLDHSIDIDPIIAEKCSPCHIPEKGGKMTPLNNFTNVERNIDEIIRRIQLNPGEKGYMPFKKPKLSDSTINVFKKWKADGMIE